MRNLRQCEIQLFNNDTLLNHIRDNIETVVRTINKDLIGIQTLLMKNGLSLNFEKTKLMLI